ncbi:MAG: cupin domain-containing protein [Holophagales bacterium]|nr:cupin domain-containing protein [Holophagales bacterium]
MTRRPEAPLEHPPGELIEDYVLGALTVPSRALLEAHLALCPSCRSYLAELTRTGSAFVAALAPATSAAPMGEGSDPELPNPELWQRLESRLGGPGGPWGELPVPAAVRAELSHLDTAETLDWQPVGPCRIALVAAEPESEVLLHLVSSPAVETFPRHRHVGGEELVILEGGLTDPVGHMQVGDFRAYPPGSVHAPVMDAGPPCLALVLTRGGVEFF